MEKRKPSRKSAVANYAAICEATKRRVARGLKPNCTDIAADTGISRRTVWRHWYKYGVPGLYVESAYLAMEDRPRKKLSPTDQCRRMYWRAWRSIKEGAARGFRR